MTTSTLAPLPNTKVDPYQDPSYNQPHGPDETSVMRQHRLAPGLQECIYQCLDCHKICLSDVMNHCLEAGEPHVEPCHFRLMINCAEICQTSANFMVSNSPLYSIVCSVCAQVCEACAVSCEAMEGMAECAAQCRKCADSCRRMAPTPLEPS